MKTYPDKNVQPGSAVGFEVDNIYVSLRAVVRILKSVNGVTGIKRRRLFRNWEDIHILFNYRGHECVVIEPFGDSSRYWIGPKKPKEKFDIGNVEVAFSKYDPPIMVKIFGDLVTLKFKSFFKNY